MLMTVLKGELAVKQSVALVRTFKKMKDYILENRDLIGQREVLQLSIEETIIDLLKHLVTQYDIIEEVENTVEEIFRLAV